GVLDIGSDERELCPADLRHFVYFELKRGGHAEVRPRTTDRPEQVRVLVPRGPHLSTVSEHELNRPKVIDSQAVLAGEEADAARRGEPTDADATVVPRAESPAVRVERCGDLLPGSPRTNPHQPAVTVDYLDGVHPADIDDDAAVVRRATADPVPTAANSQRQVRMAARERQRVGHLFGGTRPQNEPRCAAPKVRRRRCVVRGIAWLYGRVEQGLGHALVIDAWSAA